MKPSNHNIIAPIRDSEEFFIVNPLSGSADIINNNERKLINQGIDISGELAERGYIVDETAEKRAFKHAYLDFTEKRESDETQIFFVTNYACNFACTYCYQEGYNPIKQSLQPEVIDAFFDYVDSEFAGRPKYVTVFGGEPLMPGDTQRKHIAHMIERANKAKLDLAFITNGYTLASYVDLLQTGSIREVQVTLDGTEEVHNNRRYLKGNLPTFAPIIKGIDAALQAGITINLRMVVDRENIENLAELAKYAIEKGWTKSPLFKTQIGRNYELHHCNSTPDKLYSRVQLYEKMYDLLKEYPHIAEFYQPAFSISKYISENEALPTPLFDSCPACKTEWAFDFTGAIYSCTATVGKQDEQLGTFYPSVTKNEEAIAEWRDRDITTIEECKTCSVALACGGGCASVAKNKIGKTNSPDCRPVKELLGLGAAYYLVDSQ